MSHLSRRTFLKAAGAGALTSLAPASVGRVLGANDRIRIAVAGLNDRGGEHVKEWLAQKGVEITYMIDPDTRVFGKRLKQIGDKATPQTIQDVRQALDDKNLDAISIATPNHWHALMTVWACQAGKDVYVEKPCSHNVHEGKAAIAAARKYSRIVQHGTQSRSDPKWRSMAEIVKSGKYGKLLISRGLVYKWGAGPTTRGDLGFRPPKSPPSELNFDIWLGPATKQPYHENLVHYRWHWFWDFGNGDIGNQGVHQMDIARWMIPGATLPKTALSLGGRIGFKDQGQTASTQLAVFDFGGTQVIFEVRGFKSKKYPGAADCDNVLHFEEGTVAGGKFTPKGKSTGEPLPKVEAAHGPGGNHFGNFIAAVRSRHTGDLNAEIQEGHLSCAMIHLANASIRTGDPEPFESGSKSLNGNADAAEALARMEEHLAKECKLNLSDWKLTVGKKLTVDAGTAETVNAPDANRLLTREYRAPYVVPTNV
ncbi:MAG TPA: Gfo/Idh/MocA family oxidoreductase [Gemmataceae bacterium]|jgi:predicted dehydrogenase|nr:Gfo/Idh/MocA family oxidoreductase [Gemmataceae bacterium]